MKYARIQVWTKDGAAIIDIGGVRKKVVKGRVHSGAFEIAHDDYPPRYDGREMRVVELISKQEYFKALLNGEG